MGMGMGMGGFACACVCALVLRTRWRACLRGRGSDESLIWWGFATETGWSLGTGLVCFEVRDRRDGNTIARTGSYRVAVEFTENAFIVYGLSKAFFFFLFSCC